MATSVTSPLASTVTSTVTIEETTTDLPSTSGYEFFGQQINIIASPATTWDKPYQFEFVIDASLLNGETQDTIQFFRNGAGGTVHRRYR